MATHDYVIANGTGAAVRSDINGALAAIVSNNSDTAAPATTYAYQWWADTTNGVMKLRNAANSAWITLFQLDGEWSTLAIENGTAAAPSIYFKDSGTDTGFYSPGTDQIGISTGGTARLTIDANGNVAVDTNSLYVDAANNRVGIGSSTPGSFAANALVVEKATTSGITISESTGAGSAVLAFAATSAFDNKARIFSEVGNANLKFATSGSTAVTIDASQRVGIGTTSPGTTLHLSASSPRFRLEDSDGGYAHIEADGGNLFLVSDNGASQANSFLALGVDGTERARIDSSGRLLVGTSSASAAATSVLVQGNGSSSTAEGIIRLTRGTTTPGASDELGTIAFGDSNHNTAAYLACNRDGGTWNTSTSRPTRLSFSTTADGASSPTERMRIGQNGYLKASNTGSYIATSNAYHELVGDANNELVARITNTNSSSPYGVNIVFQNVSPNNATNYLLNCADSTATRATIRSNGGLANYSANNANLSDRNAKKDISPAAGTWDCIKEWEIVNYRYKDQPDDADLNLGVIAQQVAESCPEVITVFEEAKDDQPEKLGVKEQQMYWMAIKALQEAQVRIESLEAKVAALESA